MANGAKSSIDLLGYRPTLLARKLAQGRSNTLGIVGFSTSFLGSGIYRGFAQAASEQGYMLVSKWPAAPNEETLISVVEELVDSGVDGIIWGYTDDGKPWGAALKKAIAKLPVPIVFTFTKARPGIDTIAFDNVETGRIVTNHLIKSGRQHIAHISGPSDWWTAVARLQGWKEALKTAGRKVDERLLIHGDWYADAGYAGMRELLSRKRPIDAVFAANDRVALGALRAIHEAGMRVPDDIAVVGVDNMPEAAFFTPPLTSVYQNKLRMTEFAVRRLIARIEREVDGLQTIGIPRETIPQELILRESAP